MSASSTSMSCFIPLPPPPPPPQLPLPVPTNRTRNNSFATFNNFYPTYLPALNPDFPVPILQSSVPSTSSATLPTSIPSMSFSMSQGSQAGGMMQPTSFRQYGNMNGAQNNAPAPQIYSAVYSGVDVYEMEINNIAVMRRRKDCWLNATQILKVAGIEKGKRTKVLEKEILIGDHEKVQGGYGKYQGTWIKFDRGVEFCRQYGVEEILRPLLTYDMGQDGGIAGRGGIDTPTKEQAMAAQRKRLYNSGSENRTSGQSGTFFKNISSTASHAVAAISKARFDSPVPRIRNSQQVRPGNFSRQPSMQYLENQDSGFPGNSQQSIQSFATDNSFSMQDPYSQPQFSQTMSNGDFHEPPRKRVRHTPSVPGSQPVNTAFYDTSMRDGSPTEANESFMYQSHSQLARQDDEPVAPLPPFPTTSETESSKSLLMNLFMDPTLNDFDNHEVFQKLSGEELDTPIDAASHTALHWAATLARMPLVRALINHGASIYRVDAAGETALMRACVVTNNFDMESFAELLEMLGPSIELRDLRGRTILHHIAVTSAVKGRSQASKYYLDSLLEFVVRNGSVPNSQTSFGGTQSLNRSMGIARFMSEIVNAQDKSGDTALNIAARIGNRSIISQLIEVSADAGIPNHAGLRPVDFGIGDPTEAGERHALGFNSQDKISSKTKESSTQIITSISALLSETEKEFQAEMEARHTTTNAIHAQLRDSSAQLGEERRHLETLQQRAKDRAECEQKIANLRRAATEERYRLSQLQQQYGHPMNGEIMEMHLGDADKSVSPIPPNTIPSNILINSSNGSQDPNQNYSHLLQIPNHVQLLTSIPPTPVLKARLTAYASNNQGLEDGVGALKSKSSEVEAKYRKIIGFCTGEEESRVDGIIDNLLRAIDSEPSDVELGRVNEFLRKVEGVD